MRLTSKDTQGRRIVPRMLWALVTWFAFFAICYIFLFLEDEGMRKELTQTGIFISKDIASQAGLPLLERNFDRLGTILNDISKRPGVVYASIIDHKNKLIAYTDQKQFLTLNQNGWNRLDQVQYSVVTGTNDKTVINFSSDVTFSGTRIGEVFISLATQRLTSKKQLFLGAAFLSLALIIALFVSARKKENPSLGIYMQSLFKKKKCPPMTASKIHAMTCPLCGKESSFFPEEFARLNLNRTPIIKATSENERPLMLKQIGKAREMNWLKQRIVLQCTKIINKLIVN